MPTPSRGSLHLRRRQPATTSTKHPLPSSMSKRPSRKHRQGQWTCLLYYLSKQVKQWFYKLPVAGVGIEAVKLRNRIAEKRAKFSNNENSRKVCEKTCKISKKWQKVQIYLDEVKSVCKIRQRRLNKSKVTKKLSD